MPLKKVILLLFLIPLFNFSQEKIGSNKSKGTIYSIDIFEFKKDIARKSITIIDVRTKKEYDLGHIDQALNISIKSKSNFKKKVNELDRVVPVYVYCYSGFRSKRASKILRKSGFKVIYDFKGGWKAWTK